jgi:hypothetical protein
VNERYAKYYVRVHASNRNAEYGKPVTVIAQSRGEAVTRAIDLGWSGHRRDARVTFDRVEDIDPRECPHVTNTPEGTK